MKLDLFRPVPAQAYCKRCGDLFCYFKVIKPRIYHPECAKLEAIDTSRFVNAQYRIERIRGKERRRIKRYPPR